MSRMAPGAMPKPSDQAKAAFTKLVPDEPAVTMRPMFGNLAAFVNGNMFAGLFGEDLFVRLPDDQSAPIRTQGGRELMPSPLADPSPLGQQDDESADRDVDPARAPRPDVARHVGARAEEPEDRDGEELPDLAGRRPPRHCFLERARCAELKQADEEHRACADADEERDQMDVEDVVVRVQSFSLSGSSDP